MRGIDMERLTTMGIIDLGMIAVTIEAPSTTVGIRNITKDTTGATMNTTDTITTMTDIAMSTTNITDIMIATKEDDTMVLPTIMVTIEDTKEDGDPVVAKKTGLGAATIAVAVVAVGIRVNTINAGTKSTEVPVVPVAVKVAGLKAGAAEVAVTRTAERENVAKSTKNRLSMLHACLLQGMRCADMRKLSGSRLSSTIPLTRWLEGLDSRGC